MLIPVRGAGAGGSFAHHDRPWTLTGAPGGPARYAQRKWLSEAPNGWIKEVLGLRRFSVRGLDKVRWEWNSVCLALNVKRLQPLLAA